MSRFVERLNRLFKSEPQPMGFVVNKVSPESLKMQLIAYTLAQDMEKIHGGLTAVDAALVEVARVDDISAIEKLCESKDGIPAGGWLRSPSSGTLEKALKATCDFWVFPASAPLALTQIDKTGRIIEVDYSWPDALLRTANDLPLDAVLASAKKEDVALTLNRLMALQRLVYLIQKPLLVFVPDEISDKELQTLWDMGISGVVIHVSDETAPLAATYAE